MAGSGRNRPEWIRHSGIGIEFAAAVGGFAAVGYWIDRTYGSAPWGVIVGAALGLIGGMYNLVKASLKAFQDQNSDGNSKDQENDEHDKHE